MTQEKNSQFFSILQSDYAAWLSQILLASLYEEPAERKKVIFPALLTQVIEHDIAVPARVCDSQGILHELGKGILNSVSKPSRDEMETFLVTFENFQSALQTLENGVMFSDFGIDELTGLPTQEKMMIELQRELERRSRRGQPFCLAISQIDGDEPEKNSQSIILAAKAIQQTIRSFDDAYVIDNGVFLSSLKHSDNNGGLKFVNRLNKILARDLDVTFSMSSIVAEPMPGDNLHQMIEAVKTELKKLSSSETGIAEEYKEISPLGLYLKSIKEKI